MKRTLTYLWQHGVIGLLVISMLVLPTVACSVDQVLSDIDLTIQTANVVCQALGPVLPADAAACQLVAGVATVGLGVIRADYDAWKASGASSDLQKLQAAIAQLQANLPAELAAARISDSHSVQVVTAWVKLVTTTLNAILGLIPQVGANSTKASRQRAVEAALPTPETLKARWTAEVCLGDATCGALVHVRHEHQHSRAVRILTLGIAQ